MKLIKILMFVILGSLCLGSVFALEGIEIWYPLLNNVTDMSINNNDGINNGVTFNGQYGSFDGSDDIEYPNINIFTNTNNFTIRGEFYVNSLSSDQWMITTRKTKNILIGFSSNTGTDKLEVRTQQGGSWSSRASTSSLSTNTWYSFTAIYDSSNGWTLYLNGSNTNNGDGNTNSFGGRSSYNSIGSNENGNYLNGRFKQFSVWNRVLNSSEISNLNECNQLDCSVINTPTIETDVQDFYSSTDISFNLTTNPVQNTNISMFLDNQTEVIVCTECNTSIVDLFNLSEGSHSIEFVSTNEDGQVNSSYNFTIDTTPPGINNSLPINISSYNLGNVSNYVNCSDIGNGSCIIEFSRENSTINVSENYTFNKNGNQDYIITATDQAGNSAQENGTIFVNPYQYFYFETPGNNPISNFTINGTNYESYAAIQVYDLGLGQHQLQFKKSGYQTTNFATTFTNTSQINTTEEIKVALLHINIRDRESKNLLNKDVDITLVGDKYSASYNTSTGQITINDIKDLPGEYRLSFSAQNYSNNEYYFQHTGYSEVNITTYLIEEDLTIPTKVNIQDIYSNPISGCLVKTKQRFVSPNDYILVDQGTTNSNGEVVFDLQDDIYYQFVVECNGVVQTEPGQKVTSNIIYITFDTNQEQSLFDGVNDVTGDITWNNYSNTSGYFKFEYNDLDNVASQGCLKVYEQKFNGNVFINSTCANSASASINTDLNYSEGKSYVAKGYITKNGKEYFVDSLTKSFTPGSDAWKNGYGLWASVLIIALLFIIGTIMHPFAGIAMAWIGTFVSVLLEALQLPEGTLLGLGALLIGVLIFRGGNS